MEYKPIPEERIEDVVDFLKRNLKDEPLTSSVGLSPEGLMKYYRAALDEGMSVMAVGKESGDVIGVAVNGTSRKGDVEKGIEDLEKVADNAYKRVFNLVYTLNKELDIFASFRVEKVLELMILSVHPQYRGQGIAKKLIHRSERLAIDNGYTLIKMDASSLFTQKAAERLGYKTLKSVSYEDYKDDRGMKIYPVDLPHESLKVIAKELPSSN